MPRKSRFPIPANVCATCWLEGKVVPASKEYINGYPCNDSGHPYRCCARCVADLVGSGWQLIPASSPTAVLDAALSRMEGLGRRDGLPQEPSKTDVQFNRENPPNTIDWDRLLDDDGEEWKRGAE